jgi:hypothetical protein
MKLSIEAKVAAVIAAAFTALTVGAIGQANSGSQTGEANGYSSIGGPGVKTKMLQQGYNISLPSRTDTQESRTRPSQWVDSIRL